MATSTTCRYYTERTLGWMMNNKVIVILSALSFCLLISTWSMAAQRNRALDKIDQLNAELTTTTLAPGEGNNTETGGNGDNNNGTGGNSTETGGTEDNNNGTGGNNTETGGIEDNNNGTGGNNTETGGNEDSNNGTGGNNTETGGIEDNNNGTGGNEPSESEGKEEENNGENDKANNGENGTRSINDQVVEDSESQIQSKDDIKSTMPNSKLLSMLAV